MENGYEILWTDYALNELAETYKYLEINFSESELQKLSQEIEKVSHIISQDPGIFPSTEIQGVRKIVIKKYNTLYYRKKENQIEILSFFSNRKDPNKRNILP
jgi:plasmid stabilization system protein ParE